MNDCYCARLRAATRRIGAVYDEALTPLGINVAQYALMSIIQRQQPLSLTELGNASELERSTVGRNVRVLERAGLVEVGRGEGDVRETAVNLSSRGAEVMLLARPRWEACQQAIEARLGADKIDALNALLDAI